MSHVTKKDFVYGVFKEEDNTLESVWTSEELAIKEVDRLNEMPHCGDWFFHHTLRLNKSN